MRELDEFEASNTKRIIFGLVGLVALAAGIGFLFRSKGIGEAEQDHRILIVEDRTLGFEHFVADLGFEAISGDWEAWQSELAEQDGSKAAGEFELPDLLEFADRHGYGYVVIESPQRFADEIAALELDEDAGATSLGESEFAVLSVGDFADPHQLGVDPPASSLELDVGRRMLRTLFAHPRLRQTLEGGAAGSDIQVARLKLDGAVEAMAKIAEHEARATRVLGKLEGELAGFASKDGAHRARVLHEPLAGAIAWPLQDGRVVLRTDRMDFTLGPSGLELQSESGFSLRAIPAGVAASVDAAVACPELLGGGRERYMLERMELSADRDALFVVERDDEGVLFGFDAAAGPCGLREVGRLPLPSTDNTYAAVSRRGIAMRHVDDDGALHIDVQVLGEPPSSITVDEVAFDSSSSLVWLDERRLGNLVDLVDGRSGLVVVDLDRAHMPALLPLQPPQVDEQAWAHELARIPGGDPALLVRWSVGSRYTLSRLDFDRPWAELIADEPPPPETIAWTRVVQVDAHMRGFELDPTGRAVAFTVEGDLGVDVVLAPVPSEGGQAGEQVVILDDAYEHREVAFRPQHDELLFRTRIRLEKPEGSMLTVHAIDVETPN